MKEKKYGFSIPELLAVIVIIGILATIATASYNGISKSVKEKTYQSKINLIKSKAIEYASDNNVDAETISVAKLINEGYLDVENDTDANEKLNNPNGGYLDCYQISINKNVDDYDINVNSDDTCNLANLDNVSSKINILVYESSIVNNNVQINYNSLGSNNNVKWTNKDVYLFVDPKTLPVGDVTNATITWSLNSDINTKTGRLANTVTSNLSYANIYHVETSYLFNNSITAQIEINGIKYSQKVNVKIDKEKPNVAMDFNASYEKLDENTKKATKIINFTGADGYGSGIGYNKGNGKIVGYFLTDNQNYVPNIGDFNIGVDEHTTNVYENGTYYGYSIDAVGNISNATIINVNNVEYNLPICLLPKANNKWTNQNYTYTYGCKSDKGTGCSYEPISKTVEKDTDTLDTFTWQATDNIGNSVSCEAKNLSVKVDKTAPTCSINVISGNLGNNNWYTSDVVMQLSYSDNLSGVAEYGISTNSNVDFNHSNTATLNFDTAGTTYYGYVKDVAGNIGNCNITLKRVTTPPTCSLNKSGNLGNNGWYKSDVNISMETKGFGIVETKIYSPNGAVNNSSYTLTYDVNNANITGEVTNEAGLNGTCSTVVKRDVTPPVATLRMKTTHHCEHSVAITSPGSCGGSRTQSMVMKCDEWNQKNLNNATNLESYVKSVSSNYTSYNDKGEKKWDDVSTNQAELVCKDGMTSNVSYNINGRSGSLYDLDSDSEARNSNNRYYTMSGTCMDEAGNTSTSSKNFHRYEDEKYCESTHDECVSTHLEVTNCDDGNNYTTSGGNNCGGADSNGEYGSNGDGTYYDCGWSGGGSGSSGGSGNCGHVNEVCDDYRTVSDGYYKCGDNKWE